MDDTVLKTGTERKLKMFLEKVLMESKKKGLTSRKTEYIIISKREVLDIYIENTKMNLGSIVTDNRKWNKEIQKHIGIEKDVFQKLNKILRHGNFIRNKEN